MRRRGIKRRSVHTCRNRKEMRVVDPCTDGSTILQTCPHRYIAHTIPPPNPNPIRSPSIHLHANVMEPTTTTTTTPAAAEPGSRKASGNKRQRKAALLPLGDVTNLLPNTPTNPSTRRPLPLPSASTACSSASASVTPVSKGSFAAVAEEHSSAKSAISTAYTRRKTTERRRRNSTTNNEVPSPAGTSSCPSLGKGSRTSRKTSVAQDTQPISSSVPCHQAKKMRRTRKDNLSSGKPKLPEDFVKKQRAYFDEIDAFELPEEAASETDLE